MQSVFLLGNKLEYRVTVSRSCPFSVKLFRVALLLVFPRG